MMLFSHITYIHSYQVNKYMKIYNYKNVNIISDKQITTSWTLDHKAPYIVSSYCSFDTSLNFPQKNKNIGYYV